MIVEVLNVALFKILLKVNVGIFEIVGVQEEKRGGAGRTSLQEIPFTTPNVKRSV